MTKHRFLVLLAIGAPIALALLVLRPVPPPPRLELVVVGRTNTPAGEPAVTVSIRNPGEWIVNRHSQGRVTVEGLGDQFVDFFPVRALFPGQSEELIVPAPAVTARWRIQVSFSSWETASQARVRGWWGMRRVLGLGNLGRSPRPNELFQGTADSEWIEVRR